MGRDTFPWPRLLKWGSKGASLEVLVQCELTLDRDPTESRVQLRNKVPVLSLPAWQQRGGKILLMGSSSFFPLDFCPRALLGHKRL